MMIGTRGRIGAALCVFAGAAVVVSPLNPLDAQAQPAVASAHCNWHTWHRIDRYTSWRYVDPLLAKELHVGSCSKVISGTDGSVVFTQRGYVAEAS